MTGLVAVTVLVLGAVLLLGDRGESKPGQEGSPSGPGASSPSLRLPSDLPSRLPSSLPSGFPTELPTRMPSLPGLPTAFPTDILGL
ncbi:hypothetical protein AB0K89_21790 [Streptomyces cinnamoneus]|uniref:hypothetical protein n=1 Tax=Streptomyces cinnamoneus TaxID=53446 RepID=UPI00342DE0CC